jgi:hypothetical protein
MDYPGADRFLRELLLYRYNQMIELMQSKFSLTKEQVSLLRENILKIQRLRI